MVAVSVEDVVPTAESDKFAARYVFTRLCVTINLLTLQQLVASFQSSVWYVLAVVAHLSRRNVVTMSAQGAVTTAGMQWLASSEPLCLAWVYGSGTSIFSLR